LHHSGSSVPKRVTAVYKPSQYPGTPSESTRQELAELFQHLLPRSADPEIDERHAGIAIAAQNPKLALALAKLSGLIGGELPWSRRQDLRELAIQTVNLHFKSDYSFNARIPNALAGGIGADLLAALPSWRTSTLFSAEQRLIIEYAEAVASGKVSDELFARLVASYGEKEAIECTALVAFWSFWAMFLKATHP
jgi:alkylhydroperoxidase family enzyme